MPQYAEMHLNTAAQRHPSLFPAYPPLKVTYGYKRTEEATSYRASRGEPQRQMLFLLKLNYPAQQEPKDWVSDSYPLHVV
jgi:hypothetical protein